MTMARQQPGSRHARDVRRSELQRKKRRQSLGHVISRQEEIVQRIRAAEEQAGQEKKEDA